MAISAIAALGTIATLAGGQPAEEAASDPCRFGVHGPAADITLADTPPVYPGFTGESEALTVSDPCGLRFTDLSGVWERDGVQLIADHNLRTGEFALRFMHVPFDDARFRTWGFRFGDPSASGRIGPQAETIELFVTLRFPTRLRGICPEEGERNDRAHRVALDYDDEGRPRISLTRMHSLLSVAPCRVEHVEFVPGSYTLTSIGRAP